MKKTSPREPSKRAAPSAREGASEDQYGRALAQCSRELRAPAWFVTATACLVHVILVGAASYVSVPSRSLAAKPATRELFDVELPPPAPAVEEPEPTLPPAPEPARLKIVKAAPKQEPALPEPEPAEPPSPAEEAPAAAAAQAAEAVVQEAPAPTPQDTLVTGQAASYAGGTSERGGAAAQAVHAQGARAFGVSGGTGTGVPDRSRPPQLASGTNWDCPLPEEALEEGVEHATVGLDVEIGADGKLVSVEVKVDPGSGFGREARACALRKRWLPALDRNGGAIRMRQRVNVSFHVQ